MSERETYPRLVNITITLAAGCQLEVNGQIVGLGPGVWTYNGSR